MYLFIITASLHEIRDTYFEEALEDQESFPSVTRTGLLMTDFEGSTQQLHNDLFHWHCQHLFGHQTLWYSEHHRAAFLQIGTLRVKDIYLFTFADSSSLTAGVAEIEQLCRRQR